MSASAAPAALHSRAHPFSARLIENRLLTRPGSAKETRHLVVDLIGSTLRYHAGDSLGVFPRNPPVLVGDVERLLKLDIEQPVNGLPLREVLATQFILNRVSKKFVKTLAEKLPAGSARERLSAVCADEEKLDAYVWDRDYVDVLTEYPGAKFTCEEFLATLSKLQPRLYSIASSPKAFPSEVHLTVAVVSYESHGRLKYGVASGYLGRGVPVGGASLPVYVQSTRHFHLPADPARDIIMVGPGTGIAPFRAFLQERRAERAPGRNWLFFGDQKRATDFLYEEELTRYQADGTLARLDVAFSRDQAEKVYVQDRMRESGRELWKWLQDGAYFYVCGDAKRMARDVHAALIAIAREHGGLSAEAATEYVEVTLAKTEKRYLKDVY
jgi:sulfite reductase (NADPH) flavoprotein alpha-component